jgi:hypothetical protein
MHRPTIRAAATPEILERGRYLAINVLQCVDRHSVCDWTLYGGPPQAPLGAGRPCLDRQTPRAGVNVGQEFFPGVLRICNIKPNVDTGIGAWTDGEITRAVRERISKDGHSLFLTMPYFVYRRRSDDDVAAALVFLRTLPAAKSMQPPRQTIELPLNWTVRL